MLLGEQRLQFQRLNLLMRASSFLVEFGDIEPAGVLRRESRQDREVLHLLVQRGEGVDLGTERTKFLGQLAGFVGIAPQIRALQLGLQRSDALPLSG